jgi:3-methyladenine DNA glycosylase AlkD
MACARCSIVLSSGIVKSIRAIDRPAVRMKPEALRNSIVRDLKSRGTPGGNPKLQAYLGSPYPVLGLSTPQMREVMKARQSQFMQMSVGELNILSGILWAEPTLEEKSFAISLFGGHSSLLDDESWSIMNRWIEQASGWALCDSLGSGPISSMLYRDPSRFEEVLEWTRSANLWRRRVSACAMRDFIFAGRLERPFVLLERLLYDKEFWVQRAVGTWLRECWKKDRRKTEAFLLGYVRGLPRVVITVATERAPRTFKEKLRRMRK